LTAVQIERLRKWIADGAQYERHWAFQPIRQPEIPSPKSKVATDIDRFVVARLEAQGLSLSPRVGRQQLIRRVTEHYEFFDIVKHSDGKGDTVAIRPTELLVRVYRETLVSEIDERFRPVASPESTNPQASTAAGHPCDASAEAPAAGRLR